MTLALLLPWFPIVLASGVGGHLLGRSRGLAFGTLCSVFWVALVHASVGASVWLEPASALTVFSGTMAIALMGRWAAMTQKPIAVAAAEAASSQIEASVGQPKDERLGLAELSTAYDDFDLWLETHGDNVDPWRDFDEFIRKVIYDCCGGTHTKPLRLLNDGRELLPLADSDADVEALPVSARAGILGHVVTSGRAYIADDGTDAQLINRLAAESAQDVAWCFPVGRRARRVGVVQVGCLPNGRSERTALLHTVERMVNHFWLMLSETVRGRTAIEVDPVTGVRTRAAFLHAAEESVRESYRSGEPVAIVVLALEGLRPVNDSGRWEVGDDIMRAVSDAIRRKVRLDDRLGRFDGASFILMLRRVDSELALLIVEQIQARVEAACGDGERFDATVRVRCGLAGSGLEQPDVRTLVTRALGQCSRARDESVSIAADVDASVDKVTT